MASSVLKEHCGTPLSMWSPIPEGIDADRVEAADKIIEMGKVAVCKPTRSGFTTSAVIAAERRGLKTLVVAPTRKILTETVRGTVVEAGGIPCDIPGHNQCKFIREMIDKDPLLAELPLIFTDRCEGCEDYDKCPITEIERTEEFTTATITYSKLESLMLSSSDSSEFIKERLNDVKLVILDEAHLLSFPSLPQVDFDKYVAIPERYGTLRFVYDKWRELVNENRDQAMQIEFETEQNPQHYTGFSVPTHYFPEWHDLSKMWGELIHLAENRASYEISDDSIRSLRDIIAIMSGRTATISYLMKKDAGRMVVTGSQGRNYYALRQFLTEVVPNAKVIFVSGTLVERRDGFFSHLAGREIKSAIFPDLNDTNSMMFIHPSKWRFSNKDGKDGLDRAIKEIRSISESVGHQPIYLLAMNTINAAALKKALKDLPNITIDYYKSANSIGVAQAARICIAVGAAELPRHACDPLAEGKDDYERFYDSQQLRVNTVDCATWQSWSRVKDPDGLVESHVYCIGIRAKEVSRIVTWGTKREVKVELNSRGGIDSSVKCDEYLGRPNIIMESRSDLRPCRRKLADYVDAVVPISEVINARQKSYTFPYKNLLGETIRFLDGPLRLHNRPKSREEFEQTFSSLVTLFVTRIDKCGLIWRSKRNGKVNFHTGAPPVSFRELLWNHLLGTETIAQPPFDLDDNCHYCALDFDDHTRETPQSENVKKLTAFLKEHGMPCIVVKSGSNDGYHAFIPIVPTRTLAAHKFLKQLIKDAGLDGIKEIERYPKQKSASSAKGGYGSQIRIPLGVNWKVNKKSVVVDPYSLEPVDFVEITHAIKLRDLPEQVEIKKPKARSKKAYSETREIYTSGEMRMCIRGVIESGVQLEGGEGHTTRVAIAAEARHCGLSEEKAIDLFRRQDDFDEQTTRTNIRYVWERNYRRYGCGKLQDECGSFVKEYCAVCHLANG
jgi:hypothetical protein